MHKFLVIFFILFSGMVKGHKLEDFNHSPKWESSGNVNPDKGLIKYFQGMDFICHNASDFSIKEEPVAEQMFSELIKYVSEGDSINDYWNDPEHRQKREDLLSSAIKAGSWKAKYVDSVWAIKYPSQKMPADLASARLREMAFQGIPIATYKYATYLFGRDDMTMYYLLAEAIKRGSPNAMELVGGTIIARAQELRPLGKQLLECAANQGHAEAYNGLGLLAYMAGRRVDAYRLWEKGINAGCKNCMTQMSYLAQVRRGYSAHVPMMELMPELTAIEKFYDNNFFWQLTELSDFWRSLPDEQIFHLNDAELLRLFELESRQ